MREGVRQSGVNVRGLALDVLLEMERGQEFSHLLLKNVLDKYDYLEKQDKAFLKRLVEGVLERRLSLDYVLDAFSSVPVKKMKPLIRCLMRMGVYQIVYMDGVPDSAAVNEAVKLAQKRKFGALKGFVNGVLRAVSRQKEKLPCPDKEKDRLSWLSVTYSMPQWIVEKWEREQGPEKTEIMLAGFLERQGVTVRMKEMVTEEERRTMAEELALRGGSLEPSGLLPYAYVLRGAEGPGAFPAFLQGKCAVQDVSSMLAVEAAGICQGSFVLDVCAAPGGKALFAAEKAGPNGRVLARDVSEYKASLLVENKERMAARNMEVQVWDACLLDEALVGKADVVLCDAPCSGLGVIGKKPDIKYRVSPEGLKELVFLQKNILETAQAYVKPGGVLLYSTCTVNRQENEEMADWFERSFPFQRSDLSTHIPPLFLKKLSAESWQQGQIQLLPGVHGTDGFFLARFVKTCP